MTCLQVHNSPKTHPIRISFATGNWIACAALIRENPSRSLNHELDYDWRQIVALGITKQLSARVLMKDNHLMRRILTRLRHARSNYWKPALQRKGLAQAARAIDDSTDYRYHRS
jgi:hypothetical protein